MVVIRLRRQGKTKQPSYRMVVTDSRSPRDGKFIEIIGHYNPIRQPKELVVKDDRARYWIGVGAQPSDKVAILIKKYGTNGTHAAAQKTALDKISQPKSVPDPGAPASLPKPKKTKEEIAAEAAAAAAAAEPKAEEAPAEAAAAEG